MTHEDRGHYAAKHPEGTQIDSRVKEAIEAKVKDGAIACKDSTAISESLGVPMALVGQTTDLLEIRLSHCQLGLYGYPEGGVRGKIVEKAESVSLEMEAAMRAEIVNDRLPCKACWEIAERFSVQKMDVAAACETLEIKIKPCQLGAFERGNM